MITLNDVARFLDAYLRRERFPDEETAGVWRPSGRSVARLGLALEPWPGLGAWAERERLDAVFLHRPFRLAPNALAPDVGVVAYHLPFDERLTLGLNARLADVLGLTFLEPLGEKEGRPLGMTGDADAAVPFTAWAAVMNDVFGGWDAAHALPGSEPRPSRASRSLGR
jgi:putative NIF3 family GTP cyclohydrolase 1 type 2